MIYGFPPVANLDARVLVLGSMPGQASLDAQEYYAHRHNAFWRIIGDLLWAGRALPYPERLQGLGDVGIALWDVIAGCERAGSLDASIVKDTVLVNNFPAFFAAHPGIDHVFFNGRAAETAFRRLVLPSLGGRSPVLLCLPSTSPAHAALPYAKKLAAWAAIVAPLNKQASAAYNRLL